MQHHTDLQHAAPLVKWSLIIGIVIVMNLFFNYAFSLVYKSPRYEDFFPQQQIVSDITTQQDCVAVGGQWNEQLVPKSSEPVTEYHGYCNPDFTKQQNYAAAEKEYNRNIFIFLLIIGVVSIVVASQIKQQLLSIALSWGGVLSLIIASLRYWGDANNIIKVVLLAIALGALIWTAIKKFG